MLPWDPINWIDPNGGLIRLWPIIPSVVLPENLRRSSGDWHGLAFLLPDDEHEIWLEQIIEEKKSPGINRDGIAASGGILGRMMQGMATIEEIQTGKFPDPEPRRLFQQAESKAGKGSRPVYFVEPDDEEWTTWVEECADEMSRPRQLFKSIFSGRSWRKELLRTMKDASPPKVVRDDVKATALAEASSIAATWWRRAESTLNESLRQKRDERLASRLRGALVNLREGQIDDSETPVLLVPVMQAWVSSIHNALEYVESEALETGVDESE